ncbi:hypothetical protein, partial [Burkholderia pseudomallei]|uniref:hypothetical protein n=1 Tax=Burkholderia pseudomallei TaxID=28450 RepID=UPI000DC32065
MARFGSGGIERDAAGAAPPLNPPDTKTGESVPPGAALVRHNIRPLHLGGFMADHARALRPGDGFLV